MANRHRGEISAVFEGRPYTLCLTLGALAELEDRLGAEDMLGLAKRFEEGRLKAQDAIAILGAGLRGGGHDIADTQVAHMKCEGGVSGFVDLVARLLEATFGGDEAADRAATRNNAATRDHAPEQDAKTNAEHAQLERVSTAAEGVTATPEGVSRDPFPGRG